MLLVVQKGIRGRIYHAIHQNYNKDSDKGYFLDVNVQYHEKLHDLHNDLLFLPETMAIEKVGKLVDNLHDKKYVMHMIKSKQTLNHGLVFINHRVIKFSQAFWLKLYIDINTELRKKAKSKK